MCKFYNHIVVSESPILKAALEESKLLSDAGTNSWYKVLKRICNYGQIAEEDFETADFEKSFKKVFLLNWEKERDLSRNEGKLGILAECKSEFNFSQYLHTKAFPAYKSAIAKFRVSSHSLPIERERYTNTRRAERLCSLGCESVGNEAHYLLECQHPSILEVTKPLLKELFPLGNGAVKMSNKEKLIYILSNNKAINISGKLCHKVLRRYNDIVF